MDDFVFREVNRESWADFARLFESRGGPKYCWCMAWRKLPLEDRQSRGRLRAAMSAMVEAGIPVGILGYYQDTPAAWCSIAPRETYRPLGGIAAASSSERVWSLACFFLRRDLRGRGLARRLLRAAIDHAADQGATVVEAYPVDPESPSYRFMGFVEMFADAGFREVGMAGRRRHVMQLELAG